MLSTSTEFDNLINEARQFILGAEIALADSTALTLDDASIIQGGMEFEDAVSSSSTFQIGAAIVGKLALTLNNEDGRFDGYEFTDAQVMPSIGLPLSETTETLQKGYYTVDEPTFIGNIVKLECLDNMHRFETGFAGVQLTFPCTALFALQTICTYCGVPIANSDFTNSGFVIQSAPDIKELTCLGMVSYIAQIAGCYARVNVQGALEFRWYDTGIFENDVVLDGGVFDNGEPVYASGDSANGGTFRPWSNGDDANGGTFVDIKKFNHLFNFGSTPTIGIDDIVVTGVRIENTDSDNGYTVMYGTDGYVLGISDNPLIQSQSDADTIVNIIGAKIVGMRFRQFSCSVLSNPAYEAGDPVKISVRTRSGYTTYESYITGLSYKVGSRETIKCEAESPSRNTSKQYGAETRNIVRARNEAKTVVKAYDLTVQQFMNLMTRGYGLFQSQEEQPNGSVIYYMHDQPTIAASTAVWKFNENGLFLSTDHGLTWGVDTNGNMLVNVLTAKGINADWIITGTINGVRIETNSGKIGPFEINANGLFSEIIEIYEDSDYPLMWLTKKGPNGEAFGVNGTQKANYEPSVAVVRAIEDGAETDVVMMARDDSMGQKGKLSIDRYGDDISENMKLTTDGLSTEKWEGTDNTDDINLTSSGALFKNPNRLLTVGLSDGGSIIIYEDDISIMAGGYIIGIQGGNLTIQWDGGSIASSAGSLYLNSIGHIYANGKQID